MRNPAIDVDAITIFDNPPLTQMSKLDYHTSNYVASDTIRPKNAPPLVSADSHWWQILTFCDSPGRALQIATECFTGQKNGRMFLRTRHVDNYDFTQWQAWREVATCACADLEWKPLPMINGWINSNSDKAAALRYRKGADGKVTYITGIIKLEDTLSDENQIFAYLPEGYRPKQHYWTGVCVDNNKTFWPYRIDLDGRIYINSLNATAQESAKVGMWVNLIIPI